MKYIPKHLFWAIFTFAHLYSPNQSFSQDYQKAIEKARFLITHHQKQTNIPGVQVALMIDNELVWSEGLGYANLDKQYLITAKTVFRIASISKSLTSVVLGKLIENGVINPYEDIRNYIPEFPATENPITVEHLANSVSGIRHYTSVDPKYNLIPYSNVIDALEKFKDDELLFEPGTDFHYSSYGWVLLSAVMERATETPFRQLMESEWRAWGLEHTYFDDEKAAIPNRGQQFILGKKGQREVAPKEDRSYMWAGGGYLSTAEDLAKFGSAFLKDSLVSPETRAMLTDSYILPNGQKTNYGWGWETGQSRLNTPIVYHSGSMSSARSHLVLYPDENVVFSYISNTGDHVFFNEREAQIISELFVEAKNESTNQNNYDEIVGSWNIKTRSLRNRKSRGVLTLSKSENGLILGEITFKRSREKKSFPILVTKSEGNQIHLVAVTPMFIDFYLDVENDNFEGQWLHDFNVLGVPETDDYWKTRRIVGNRK